jgi:hypothetical protein
MMDDVIQNVALRCFAHKSHRIDLHSSRGVHHYRLHAQCLCEVFDQHPLDAHYHLQFFAGMEEHGAVQP